jgi:hypothetical protein
MPAPKRLSLRHYDSTTVEPGEPMTGERVDAVAIMAAIIYAGRTGESGQVPNEKVFGVIAKAAWDLHQAVVERGGQVQLGRA